MPEALACGHRLVVLGQTASTNASAIELMAFEPATGLWVVALQQTQGRGRGGDWIDLKGNLAASFAFYAQGPYRCLPLLSIVASLALYEAVAEGLPPHRRKSLGIKWPNDLLLDGRKCAGSFWGLSSRL